MCSIERRRAKFGRGLFFLFMGALFVLAMGFVVMWLWNAILPEITNVSRISFWQALGLFILARILFGGFRWGNRGHRHDWKQRRRAFWQRKWERMDPEKKEQLKEKFKSYYDKRDC